MPVPEGLRWAQPQIEPRYHELRDSGDRVHGTLRFAPKGAVVWAYKDRRRARAEFGPSHWDLWIERSGLSGLLGFSAKVVITGRPNGVVNGGAYFLEATIELENGRRLRWSGGAARSPSTVLDETGAQIVQFEPGSIFERINTYVNFQPAGAQLTEWPLIAAVGLYLRLTMNKPFK